MSILPFSPFAGFLRPLCGVLFAFVTTITAFAAPVTVLDDSFDYTGAPAMYANGWEHVRGGTPGFFNYDGGRALKLNNTQVKRDFSSIGTITEDFELSVEFALTKFPSGLYLLLTSAPDSEGKIYGYGISWNSGTATGGNAPNGFLTIDTINGADESSLAFGTTIASNVVKSAAVNSGIGISGTGANVMAGSEFGSIRLTWGRETGRLNLYLGSSEEPALFILDSQYTSFSHLYLSGNDSGFFNALTLTTSIPEPGTYALLTSAVICGLAVIRRRCSRVTAKG